MKNNHFKILFALLLTGGIFAVLFYRIPAGDVMEALKAARIEYIPAAAGVAIFTFMLLGTFKWRLTLQCLGAEISFFEAMELNTGAMPIKMLMPLKSGELSKGLYLSRRGVMRFDRAMGSIIFDKALNVLSMIAIFIIGMALSRHERAAWAAVAAGILAVGAALVFWNRLWRWISSISGRLPEKWAVPLRQLSSSFEEISLSRKLILAALAFILELLGCLVTYLVFLSLKLDIPPHVVMIFVPWVILLSHLSMFFIGLGAREAAFVMLFNSYASEADLFAAGLLVSLVGFIILSAIGCLFLPNLLRRGAWPEKSGTEND